METDATASEFDWKRAIVSPDLPLRQALEALDRGGAGILLLCGGSGELIGTLTDGDIRRAILARVELERPCRECANLKPLTAPPGTSDEGALHLMNTGLGHLVHQIPLVDGDGTLVGLRLRSELSPEPLLGVQALVMAGGFGKRLGQLTSDTPKPMLPVGDIPLLERIICRLRDSGVAEVHVSTHYLADRIESHFGDGSSLGLRLRYMDEREPLGTAGAVGSVPEPDGLVLVVNGDVLTSVNFRAMVQFHQHHQADLTMAVRHCQSKVAYGVVDTEGEKVLGIREKPIFEFTVNAGMYLLGPRARALLEKDRHCDMPEVIEALIASGGSAIAFPILEYWLDVGQPEDYEKANVDVKWLDKNGG